jgi:hypothetical protein
LSIHIGKEAFFHLRAAPKSDTSHEGIDDFSIHFDLDEKNNNLTPLILHKNHKQGDCYARN